MPAANILILRHIKPDRVSDFEDAVRHWIPLAFKHHGYLGAFMLQPGPHSHEYGALVRFESVADWERFRKWPDYQQFVQNIRPMLLEEPKIETLHGLETWFSAGSKAPPRWKMAIVTWIGVNICVYLISFKLVPLLARDWPWWIAFLVANALVVCALTWIAMPLLTRVFSSWLKPKEVRCAALSD